MMFVTSLSLVLILLAPLACLSTALSLNNIVWVKICVGVQHRRGILSPIYVAKKVVNSIRSALGGKDGDKGYLKQGKPEFYFDAEKSHTDSQKCHGLLVTIPLPESIYQKLARSGARPESSDQRSEEEVEPPNPLIVDADADGKYIDTVTDYVRNLLKEV